MDRSTLYQRTVLLFVLALSALSSCQSAGPVLNQRLLYQQLLIDFSGLKPVANYPAVKASGAVPLGWSPLPLKETPLYSHMQWRSPSIGTGVGVAYIHMPLPVPASAVLWFAKREYTKHEEDGRAIGQWTDQQNRQWFEAENNKFHVRGYVVTRGFDAWIVYCGYKRAHPPSPLEFSLASRSAETIVPGASVR